jgi:hypothetical protein
MVTTLLLSTDFPSLLSVPNSAFQVSVEVCNDLTCRVSISVPLCELYCTGDWEGGSSDDS